MSSWNYPRPAHQQVPKTIFDDIENIQGLVAKHFPIYNVEVHYDTVSMKCHADESSLEHKFENLRQDMKKMEYIPLITKERGEYVVHVVKRPPMKFKGPWLNLILLIATIGTTIFAGASLWGATFATGDAFSGENLINGALYFALPLMIILGVHEMAHYLTAKRHGMAASLPFFIPAPFILGTFGAFISIREPIPSKKALLDIGFSGPIAGFVVAIPIICMGLILSGDMTGAVQPETLEGGTMLIGSSVIFETFIKAFGLPEWANIHPLAFAGWVGFFVTALNLLPVGQLDGGHIARALLGERSRWAGYGALALMLGLGLIYSGWLIFALMIMFMGLRHPPPLNDVTELKLNRKVVGVAAALMLVFCFVPIPISEVPVNYDFTFHEADGTPAGPYFSHSIDKSFYDDWQNCSFPFRIENNGNMPLKLNFSVSVSSDSNDSEICNAWLVHNGNTTICSEEYFSTNLELGQTLNLSLMMSFKPVLDNTTFTIDINEENYDWENQYLMSDSSGNAHGMRVRVIFS